ncbi:hypothetical protein [Gordonia humi]|uniref:DUF8175 domain-containing protein n=1 Tax=Gordonia humi TaxID=686429 RepID=A0A840F2E9_9ACTN|nr:hypothetical protein [Gordonia humi]MBB4138082.1 hypothetical protein [Gordonia humi]
MAKKKNYSGIVAAPNPDGAPPAATASRGGRFWPRSRPVLITAAAVIAVVVILLIVIASCSGSDDGDGVSEPGIGSAHGPTSIEDGIPTGFTQDRSGAATAGVVFTQAVDQASAGRVSGDKLESKMVGPGPSAALTEVLNSASDRAERKNVTNSAPAMVTVPLFTKDKAKVSIWAVTVGQNALGDSGKVGVATLWSTTTVTLSWIDDDWKAIDWEFQSGPTPEEAQFPDAGSSLAEQATAGYYSFFIN